MDIYQITVESILKTLFCMLSMIGLHRHNQSLYSYYSDKHFVNINFEHQSLLKRPR